MKLPVSPVKRYEHYFTPDSYIYATGTNFTEGEGATLRLSYSVRY